MDHHPPRAVSDGQCGTHGICQVPGDVPQQDGGVGANSGLLIHLSRGTHRFIHMQAQIRKNSHTFAHIRTHSHRHKHFIDIDHIRQLT